MAFVRIVNEDAMPANPVVVVGLASVGECVSCGAIITVDGDIC
jgi:hypothetical protein